MRSFTTSLALAGLAISGTSAAPLLEARQSGSTRNDLVSGSGACKSTVLIFARGTTEPGNMGVVVGTQLASALGSDVTVQGVDYAADWNGALSGGDKAGSQKMADLITQATTKCPSSTIVIGGYSQGAQLVHNAASLISSTVASKVSSAVVFGDPNNGRALKGIPKVLSICKTDDSICSRGGGSGTGGHTSYGRDAAQAAAFVKENAKVAGGDAGSAPAESVPAPTQTSPPLVPTDIVPTSVIPTDTSAVMPSLLPTAPPVANEPTPSSAPAPAPTPAPPATGTTPSPPTPPTTTAIPTGPFAGFPNLGDLLSHLFPGLTRPTGTPGSGAGAPGGGAAFPGLPTALPTGLPQIPGLPTALPSGFPQIPGLPTALPSGFPQIPGLPTGLPSGGLAGMPVVPTGAIDA